MLLATADGRLISLDAATGKPDPAFGKEGVRDLREELDERVRRLGYGCTSAPAIYRDTVILGFAVAPTWFALSAFVGAGLTFAGLTGRCGMTTLLAHMPWNRRTA